MHLSVSDTAQHHTCQEEHTQANGYAVQHVCSVKCVAGR